jgi:hypothetical protein
MTRPVSAGMRRSEICAAAQVDRYTYLFNS